MRAEVAVLCDVAQQHGVPVLEAAGQRRMRERAAEGPGRRPGKHKERRMRGGPDAERGTVVGAQPGKPAADSRLQAARPLRERWSTVPTGGGVGVVLRRPSP